MQFIGEAKGPEGHQNFEKRKMKETFPHQILEHMLRVYCIDLVY